MNEDNHLKKRHRTSPTSSPLRNTPPRYHCNSNNIISSSADESSIRSSPRLLLRKDGGDAFLSTASSTPSRNNLTSLFNNNNHHRGHEEKKEDDPLLPYCGSNNINNNIGGGGGNNGSFDDNGSGGVSSSLSSTSSFSTVTIVTALTSLFILPLLIWDDYYEAPAAEPSKEASSSAVMTTVMGCLRHIELIWCALLHISIWPVVVLTAVVAWYVTSSSSSSCSSGRGCANKTTKGASSNSLGGATAAAAAAVPSTAPIISILTKSIHCIIATSNNNKSVAKIKAPILLSIVLSILISTQSFIQMAFPSLLWNPGAWISIGMGKSDSTIYLPKDVERSLVGGCFNVDNLASRSAGGSVGESSSFLRSSSSSSDQQLHHQQQHKSALPLCLTEQQWQQLSSGTLSSSNPHDVQTVYRGLKYLQSESNGIVINVLARNVVDSIPDLRRNVEGLVPFLGGSNVGGRKKEGEMKKTKLSLVVFENDSVDGTREEFTKWADEVNPPPSSATAGGSSSSSRYNHGYNVDLITCPPPNTNCKLNIADRNEAYGVYNKTASGVGKLGEFRQLTVDYVMKHYGMYSHMIVLDVDLGVSISPLGIVHSLGMMMTDDEEKVETGSQNDGGGVGGGQEVHVAEKYVVASAATQLWPGTFGTIAPPYDLSAFRPKPTPSNIKVRTLQRKFCELMPPGDRWRNMCDAPSPMQLFMILQNNDPLFHHGDPYEVASAFNGITMYPIGLIRSRGAAARYDAGSDGQRCEHIGFNLSLRDTMMVNPKWVMHLKPNKPGGPSGFHTVTKVFAAMSKRQNVTTVISAVNMISLFVFVLSVWVISLTMKERVIPSMIDFFVGLRNRSETSFLYGYWLDFTGRGGSSSLSHHQSLQLRVMSDEEGKKLLS